MSQADSMQADALHSDFSVAGHSAMSDTQRSTFVASNRSSALRDCVKEAMTNYFRNLDDEQVSNVYELVMAEVEAPLLEVVMQRSRYNQTKAAETLGLNRGTLRKKLKQYGLL